MVILAAVLEISAVGDSVDNGFSSTNAVVDDSADRLRIDTQ